jgi:hypothetical protein
MSQPTGLVGPLWVHTCNVLNLGRALGAGTKDMGTTLAGTVESRHILPGGQDGRVAKAGALGGTHD